MTISSRDTHGDSLQLRAMENCFQTEAVCVEESTWTHYFRLVAMPTCLLVVLATPLHELGCALANKSTHWTIAILLMLCAALNAWLYGTSPHLRTALRVGVAAGTILFWIGLSSVVVICSFHQLFAFSLVTLCLLALVITLYEHGIMPTWPEGSHRGSRLRPQSDDSHETYDAESNKGIGVKASREMQTIPTRTDGKGWLGSGLISCLVLGGLALFLIVIPTINMLVDLISPNRNHIQTLTEMTFGEFLLLQTVSGAVMLLFLAIGSSIGSFLNVLIYRQPRGKPVFWPPSACQACGFRISGKDNIPILSWLRLRGRCRNCLTHISARYFIVELIAGAIFVLFLYVELLSGGWNLPVRQPNFYNGIVWILFYTKWDLVGLYVFHMLVLSLLLAWGMINYDGFRIPKAAKASCLATISLLVVLCPALNPLAAGWQLGAAWISPSITIAVCGGLSGFGLGFLIELLITRFSASNVQSTRDCEDAAPKTTPDQSGASDQNVLPAGLVANPSLGGALHAQNLPIGISLKQSTEEDSTGQFASFGNAYDDSDRTTSLAYGQRNMNPIASSDLAASLALIGLAFGPLAAITIAISSLLAAVCIRFASSLDRKSERSVRWPTVPVSLLIFLFTLVHLIAWRQIHSVLLGILGL